MIGYVLPFLVFYLAYAGLVLSGIVSINFSKFSMIADRSLRLGAYSGIVGFALVATIGVILDCAATMGEEIGWRGFLVPALTQHLSFFWTALASGLIWRYGITR